MRQARVAANNDEVCRSRMTDKRFYIETHGCQMNVYDSRFISDLLVRDGYEPVDNPRDASIVLVNTCSVRDRAEMRAVARIRELAALRKANPDLVIGVVGCMAQRLGKRVAGAATRVDLIAGFDSYPSFLEVLEEAGRGKQPVVEISENPCSLYSLRPLRQESVTAFVTIMQGCDNFCTYCVVPYIRGRERSKASRVILEEIEHLVGLGVKDVTLIGQNVNSYRHVDVDFSGLLEMANDVPGLRRIRFTTSHPKDLTLGVIERMRDLPKVCEHLHLPLQSGSDRVLSLMNRGYTSSEFGKIVQFARHNIPTLAVTTDIMVGFPTETESDFESTFRALDEIRFDAAFMFRYSPRDGTKACRLGDDVALEEKTRRLKEVISLQNCITDEKKQALLGREIEILIEGESDREPDFMLGRTRENWLAKIPREGVRRGETVVARISSATRWMVTCDRSLRKAGA